MAPTKHRKISVVGIALPLAVLAAACVDTSWQRARRADTVAAYHQFLRDHPSGSRADEAHQRIAFLRVRANPTLEAFEAFAQSYPESAYLPELQSSVEPLYFERARRLNTPEAYREFLQRVPEGPLAERARGNLVWVEEVRDWPTPASLQDFVDRHAVSDFAPEARRTLELLDARRATTFRTLGVRVDVAADVQDFERVARGFHALVARAYGELGIATRPMAPDEVPGKELDGWVRVDYAELPPPGHFGRGSLISDCHVRVYHRDQTEPVWDRHFQTPADHLSKGVRGRDRTVFGNAGYSFWREFFVPASTWANSRALIHSIVYDEPVIDVDVRGDRATVLLASGGAEYLDVASPLEPRVIQRYRRARDLARWSAVRILPGDRAALLGPSGLELVSFAGAKSARVGRWETPEVGSLRSADVYGETLLVAGSKGVFGVRFNRDPIEAHRLLDGDWVAVAVRDEEIYLVAPNQVAVATPKELLRHVTGARNALSRTFVARRARLVGDSLWVFSDSRLARFALGDGAPRPVAKFDLEQLGELADVGSDGQRLYFLGDRGLQVATPSGIHVSDWIQVSADRAMVPKGRFLLLAGQQSFEVVDVSPYQDVRDTLPASPSKPEALPASPARLD